MLVVRKDPTFPFPVTFAVRNKDGKVEDVTITIIYRLLDEVQATELDKQELKAGEYLKRVVAGWGTDVVDEAMNPLEFTPENFDSVMGMPGAVNALMKAFQETYVEVLEKNLKGLRSPSSEAASQETTT